MEDKERHSLDNLTLYDSCESSDKFKPDQMLGMTGLQGHGRESQDSNNGVQLPLKIGTDTKFPSASSLCESTQPATASPGVAAVEDRDISQSILAGAWPSRTRAARGTGDQRMARSLSESDACQSCGRQFLSEREKVKILVCGTCADKINWKDRLFTAAQNAPRSEPEDLGELHIHIENEIQRLLGPSSPASPIHPHQDMPLPTTPHLPARGNNVSRWKQDASPGPSQEMPTPTALRQSKSPARSPFSNA